ncbi:MAG: exopolysaccharide Pel transporter PelG, partial [Spirochaetes bacterium]|nr:exopolysaccharide Pel transporter PelG [Spirochaetota bacterium]
MAGIGFELKKIVRQGTIASYLQVALSGAMIVAGPWLITILAIGLIQRFNQDALAEGGNLFLATVVYTYTGSLLLFGGVHYIFSRILSDLLYEKKERQTLVYLGWFILLVGILSALAGFFIGWTIDPIGIKSPFSYRVMAGLFFLFVSLHWLLIVFASLLRWYGQILAIYAGGMGVFLFSAALVSPKWGVAGVLGGFALGNLGILLGLTILILKFRTEARGLVEKRGLKETLWECTRQVGKYVKTQGNLVLTGYFYYLGIWIDKIVFWIGWGQPVEGTWFRIFPSYDVLVYYTNLTMIPGLVFFVVFTETGFATILRKFLEGLSRRTYLSILKEKRRLYSESIRYVTDLLLFQGCISVSVALLSNWLLPSSDFPGTMYILLGGVFFHLL